MTDDNKSDVALDSVAVAEEEFDAAWVDDPEDTGTPDPDAEASGGTPDDEPGSKPDPKEDSPDHDDDYEKRFKDTQAAFTKSQQEKKDLLDRLEKLESKKGEEEDTLGEPPKSLTELEEDDPDLLEALRYEIAKKGGSLEGADDLKAEIDSLREELAQSRFHAALLGGFVDPESKKYVKGHPDAFELMATDEFNEFFGEEQERDPSLNSEALLPSEAIALVGRFKEAVASRSAENYDSKTAAEKQKADEALSDGPDETQGKKGSARPESPGAALLDQEAEFDAAWDEF